MPLFSLLLMKHPMLPVWYSALTVWQEVNTSRQASRFQREACFRFRQDMQIRLHNIFICGMIT